MIEIKAKSGYVLTQSKEVDIKERIFATKVMAINEGDWKEITQSEFKNLKQLQENAFNKLV